MLVAVIIIGTLIAVPIIVACAFHIAMCVSLLKLKKELEKQPKHRWW